jgi:hypothetical protein
MTFFYLPFHHKEAQFSQSIKQALATIIQAVSPVECALTGSGCAVRIEVENKVTIKREINSILKRFFSGFELNLQKI